MAAPPVINGKHGAILLNGGGMGSVTNLAITVVHPPPVATTQITVAGGKATWAPGVEVRRSAHPPASPNRWLLHIRVTQTSRTTAIAPGDTDDITVTVTNSAAPMTETDTAPMDGIFG